MNYPGIPIGKSSKIKDTNVVSIPDVFKSYAEIPFRGNSIPIKSSVNFIDSDTYNPLKPEEIELGRRARRLRHFQGIVRTSDGNHIIYSGGDNISQHSQLFICTINSHIKNNQLIFPNGQIGSDLFYCLSNSTNKLLNIFSINSSGLWHCGGMSILEHVLVVPLEGNRTKSLIRFLDISNPKKPKDMGDKVAISRPRSKAGAASLVRLPNGMYLCSVWTDSERDNKSKIELYLSKSQKLKDGFNYRSRKTIVIKELKRVKRPRYQMIQLLLQDDNRLYLVGAEHTNRIAPIPPGAGFNRTRLYEIVLKDDVTNSNFRLRTPQIKKEKHGTKCFGGGGNRYNFAAGVGIYITPQRSLSLYACYHRKSEGGKELQCTEFYPRFQQDTITRRKDSLIELYDDVNFKDRCMRIYGQKNNRLANYLKVYVEGNHFNDKSSSIKFQLPRGFKYELFEHKNFSGRKMTLIGTGKVQEIKNMKYARNSSFCKMPSNFSDKISSSKFN